MSEQLYKAFRIYLKEGLLGVELEDILDVLRNKGYEVGSKKRDEAIDAYMRVTKDPILGPMLPELSSYDLNTVNIEELYNDRKRKMKLNTTVETPKKEEPKDPTISMIEDKKRYNEQIEKNIAETQKVMVQEPTNEPVLSDQPPIVMQKKATALKLNQVGYANVVLMSIIVIIIVAIVCVFIFA